MFKKVVSEEKKTVKVKVQGEKKEQEFVKVTPAYTQYRIFIDSFMEMERGLHEIFNELWDADDKSKIELRINSYGGLLNEGHQFISLINNKFNGRTTTILDSAGYSMGAILFCMGDERIIMEHADLMFHDYSDAMWGKGGEIEAYVKHTSEHTRLFFKKIIVDNKFLTEKEFEEMIIGKDFWLSTDEMCKRGIATHVMVHGEKIVSKEYLKKTKKKKK